jgi:hypothetical protein
VYTSSILVVASIFEINYLGQFSDARGEGDFGGWEPNRNPDDDAKGSCHIRVVSRRSGDGRGYCDASTDAADAEPTVRTCRR